MKRISLLLTAALLMTIASPLYAFGVPKADARPLAMLRIIAFYDHDDDGRYDADSEELSRCMYMVTPYDLDFIKGGEAHVLELMVPSKTVYNVQYLSYTPGWRPAVYSQDVRLNKAGTTVYFPLRPDALTP